MSKTDHTLDPELEPLINHVRGWRTHWIGLADPEITPDEQAFWQPFHDIWQYYSLEDESCATWLYQEIGSWGAIDKHTKECWDSSMPVSYLAWASMYPDNEPFLLVEPVSIEHWHKRIGSIVSDMMNGFISKHSAANHKGD
jgi:hypothetical protein